MKVIAKTVLMLMGFGCVSLMGCTSVRVIFHFPKICRYSMRTICDLLVRWQKAAVIMICLKVW